MYVSACHCVSAAFGNQKNVELQTVVSCRVGAGDRTRVLYKGVKCSQSLSHLSRPSLLYRSCFVPPVLDDRLLIVLPHGVNVHKYNKLTVVYIRLP